MNNEKIILIIEQAKSDSAYVPTEQESAEIKGFVKDTLLMPEDQSLIADIQSLFPVEYGEAIDEAEDWMNPKEKEEYTIKITGGGTREEIAKALRTLADAIHHPTSMGEGMNLSDESIENWEGSVLQSEIYKQY